MQLTLGQIAVLVDGLLKGDADTIIKSAAPLNLAETGDIAFAEKSIGIQLLAASKATALIVPRGLSCPTPNTVEVDNPRLGFAKVLEKLYPLSRPAPGTHPTATVGKKCVLGKEVALAAGVVIGDHVTLGDRVALHPNVVVGEHVHIGDDTIVYPQAAILDRCRIGCRVIIHAGTVIGSDGFGFVFHQGCYHKIPQVGIVQIDDDVEIGGNCAIDRATLGKTWIKSGAKIDNQVHIAHNVVVGEHAAITAQVGFAGSSTIGQYVRIAGQAGIGGHLTIGDEVTIGPQAAVAQSIPDKQFVSGTTLAMGHGTWLRQQKILPELPTVYKQVRTLEKRLTQLELSLAKRTS